MKSLVDFLIPIILSGNGVLHDVSLLVTNEPTDIREGNIYQWLPSWLWHKSTERFSFCPDNN